MGNSFRIFEPYRLHFSLDARETTFRVWHANKREYLSGYISRSLVEGRFVGSSIDLAK